ncbi:hypothetical protein BGX21_000677, partial [Mortierella sp. AD011]
MNNAKRPADSAATKDGPVKRPNSGPPTKQSSLLAWAKPKAIADAPANKDADATSSSTSVVPVIKTKPDILKGLPDEKKALLQLEQDTIDATWLRALQ